MSVQATIGKTNTHGNKSFNETTTITADLSITGEVLVPAAQAGVLTVRSDDVSGSITMDSASHTIATGNRISIFWAGARAYVATVGTVAGQVVPFTLAEGDVLPGATTPLTVSLPEEFPAVFAGDDMVAALLFSEPIGAIVFTEADGATDWARILQANKSHQWNGNEDVVNPVAGDAIEKIFLSHGEITAKTMRIAVLYN